MLTRCSLELDFADQRTAEAIAKALAMDNAGYIETRVEGNILFATAEARDIMTLRNTVDDFLACATAAIKALE